MRGGFLDGGEGVGPGHWYLQPAGGDHLRRLHDCWRKFGRNGTLNPADKDKVLPLIDSTAEERDDLLGAPNYGAPVTASLCAYLKNWRQGRNANVSEASCSRLPPRSLACLI
jgi:hypothetical protein